MAEGIQEGMHACSSSTCFVSSNQQLMHIKRICPTRCSTRQSGLSGMMCKLGIILLSDLPAVWVKAPNAGDVQSVRNKTGSGAEDSKSILHAALEIDGRGFFKVLCRAGDLSNAKAEHDGLGDHLVVKDEVVGVLKDGKSLKQLSRECAKAGVVFRQLDAQKEILKGGEESVGDVLIERHSALEGATAENAGAEDHVVDAACDHACHGWNKGGRVLVVRMDHHHDVGTCGQSLAIAGLLVAAIAVVCVVDECLHA